MSCKKCQYQTPVGVVIISEFRNSTSEVPRFEGVMIGDDGGALSGTVRSMGVCGTDSAYLREVRHTVKDVVVKMFRDNYPEMAMKRWNVHVATGVAKIVVKNLCAGARERGLIA